MHRGQLHKSRRLFVVIVAKPAHKFGDVSMWLQIVWLQFAVVRGQVGVVWGRFAAGLGPFGPQTGPKSIPNDPDRTSDNLKLQPHEL